MSKFEVRYSTSLHALCLRQEKILLVMGSARFRFLFIAHVNRYMSLLLYYRAYVRCPYLRSRGA
jgi:hypothetical protein